MSGFWRQGEAARDVLRALANAARILRTSDDEDALERARQVIHRLDKFPLETIEAIRAARAAAEKGVK